MKEDFEETQIIYNKFPDFGDVRKIIVIMDKTQIDGKKPITLLYIKLRKRVTRFVISIQRLRISRLIFHRR